jgi:glycosyltransferase involved in cell wall biosynthesis
MLVALQWPTFGPYHLARFHAVRQAAPPGARVIGIATASSLQGRPWVLDAEHQAHIHTIFPGRTYHELKSKETAREVPAALARLRPSAVAIAGYGMSDSRAVLRWCCATGALRILMSESKKDDAPRDFLRELVKRYYVARFDAAICGGTPHALYAQELGMPRSHVFTKYDVVDNDFFREAVRMFRSGAKDVPRLPGLDSGTPFFLVASRLIPRKNVDGLLIAFGEYRRKAATQWRLVILGIGDDLARFESLVRQRQIPDVTFAGFHDRQGVAAYYSKAAAFVHPALQEQWGLVVNEAMASGLPVIISRTAGCAPDLVREGVNGFTFDPQNTNAITAGLEKMAALPDEARRRMGIASAEVIGEWEPYHFAESFWAAVRLGPRSKR